MRNRKFSQRAGAWILSAAMLFNGLPVNVFAESDEEIVSGESTDTVGETEEGSTGQDGTDTDTAQEVPQQDSQQNSQQDPQQNLQQETGDEESGFTSS